MKTVNIPADVDREDKIVGGLTARQLLIVAVPMIGLWATYMATRQLIPLVVFAPVAIVVGAVTTTMAVGKRDGMSLDRFVVAAIRHERSPRRLVPAPAGAPSLSTLFDDNGRRLGVLGLSPIGIDADGVIDLGPDGTAVIATATSVNLTLRSEAEQVAITASFGRFVNALDGGIQIIVRGRRVDLRAATRELQNRAPSLPHLKLEAAAREHAAFLRSLSDRPDLWSREILVVFRHPDTPAIARPLLDRRVEDAAGLLRGAGVTVQRLDAVATQAVLVRCTDPTTTATSTTASPSSSVFDEIVQGAPQ